MIHDYEHGMCVEECSDPNSFVRDDHPQAGLKIPRCEYCESFYCTSCELQKDRAHYPDQVYENVCHECSNDVEGNQLWAIGESCVEECPDGFWADEYECRRCRWGCAQCSEEEVCDACADGFILTETGKCVNECPRENYYKDPESQKCLLCPEGCARCNFDPIKNRPKCFDCAENFKLTPDYQCVD